MSLFFSFLSSTKIPTCNKTSLLTTFLLSLAYMYSNTFFLYSYNFNCLIRIDSKILKTRTSVRIYLKIKLAFFFWNFISFPPERWKDGKNVADVSFHDAIHSDTHTQKIKWHLPIDHVNIFLSVKQSRFHERERESRMIVTHRRAGNSSSLATHTHTHIHIHTWLNWFFEL
jgi:hypothetical protein